MATISVHDFPGDDIYTGFWINRSHGSFYGATLTLDRQYGGFLIAFLAIYVSLTGRSFWTIARFFMHSHFSTAADTDGIYHQRQNVLRNAKGAPDAVVDIFWIMLAWRKRAQRSVARLIAVMAVALVIWVGFAVAGVFSSRVAANNSNEVILRGSGCKNRISMPFGQESADILQYRQRRIIEHLVTALQCYQSPGGNHPRCHTFTKTKLPYTVETNATCPFDDKICRLTSGNVLLDTGRLDSLDDFGINSGPRFQFRMQRHCAPLVTKGFSTVYTDPDQPADKFMRYTYGRSNHINVSTDAENAYVYEVPIPKAPTYLDSRSLYRSGGKDYRLGVLYTSRNENTFFDPIPELNRTDDAGVALLFLTSQGLWYREKVEDPWFAATQEVPTDPWLFGNDTKAVFLPDEPAGVVGCTIQTWLCNPELPEPQCASMQKDFTTRLTQMWPNNFDRAAIRGFMSVSQIFAVPPDSLYESPGLPSLLSRFTLAVPVQVDAMPSNRWQKEMEYTFQTSLASIQSGMAAATQKGAPWSTNETHCPTPEACQTLCRNQKVRSPDFYSFSVLGVAIVLCAGFFLMLVATWIESIVACLLRCRGWGRNIRLPTYAMLEWDNNSALQLQRLAHEAVGSGSWFRTAHSVPITEFGETLGALDVSDPKHARLRRYTPLEELSDLDPYVDIGGNRSGPFVTAKKGSPDTLSPRYYSVPSNEGGDIHDGLGSPEVLHEGEGFATTRAFSWPNYMRVATQDDV